MTIYLNKIKILIGAKINFILICKLLWKFVYASILVVNICTNKNRQHDYL